MHYSAFVIDEDDDDNLAKSTIDDGDNYQQRMWIDYCGFYTLIAYVYFIERAEHYERIMTGRRRRCGYKE